MFSSACDLYSYYPVYYIVYFVKPYERADEFIIILFLQKRKQSLFTSLCKECIMFF